MSEKRHTPLGSPLKIGGLEIRNRFCIQPMECGSSGLGGKPNSSTAARYDNLCGGGAGMVVMESVTLQYESRARENQLMLDITDFDNRRAWEMLIGDLKRKYPDTAVIMQLNHSGELSDERFSRRVTVKPKEGFGGELIDEDYIDKVIESYVQASRFLYEAGCDGVDMKLCHGYLSAQILRPYNDRVWKYGGSWENRSRYAFDMCEKIRKAVPDRKFLVGAKVSVYEGICGGQGHCGADSDEICLKETFQLCRGLEERGTDFFIETLGNAENSWELMCPGKKCLKNVYTHLTMAKKLKAELGKETAVIAGGLSALGQGTEDSEMNIPAAKNGLMHWGNYCISQGDFDMIALGRQSFADPELPKKYLDDREDEIRWCTCCDGCGQLLGSQKPVKCVVYK